MINYIRQTTFVFFRRQKITENRVNEDRMLSKTTIGVYLYHAMIIEMHRPITGFLRLMGIPALEIMNVVFNENICKCTQCI